MLLARLLTGLVIVALLPRSPLWAAPGDLDPTFGSGGLVVEGTTTTALLSANAVAIQPDGLIVVAGGNASGFSVRRYLAGGTPDPSFGTGGEATADFGAGAEQASAVALFQNGPDLEIVVAGTFGSDMAVARFLPDGTLDAAFDGDGRATIDFGGSETADGVAVQPDGKVVVVGSLGLGTVGVARLDASGAPDTTFDGDGRVTTTLPGGCFGFCNSDRLYDVALHHDGPDLKIVAVGEDVFAASGSSFAVVRYLPNGAPDPAFGTAGIVTTFPTPTNLSRLLGVGVQPDGTIVAAGTKSPSNWDSVVARYTSAGVLDTTFGGTGIVSTDVTPGAFPAGFDQFEDMALLADGSVVATGLGRLATFLDTTVVRLLPTGALDPAFGTGGIVVTPLSTAVDDRGRGVAVQSDGAIVVVGTIDNTFADADAFVARYVGVGAPAVCGDGTVDPGEDCDDGGTAGGDCCSATCTYEALGAPCSDGDACTTGDACDTGVCLGGGPVACEPCESCDSVAGCVAAPATGCRTPTLPRKASLQMKDGAPDAKDQVTWKWTRGAATTVADLGTPAGSAGFALCVFDATNALLVRLRAPAGGTCGTASCWAALGGAVPKGVRYKNRAATPDGIGVLLAKAGSAGQAKASLKAKGDPVPMPALGTLALPLRAQLRTDGGLCLEATFSAAGVVKNGTTEFKGGSD